MTLTIPYANSDIQVNTTLNSSLKITFNNSDGMVKLLFDQLLYNMSYDDVINTITPQSFEQIVEYYNTDYKEE